MIKLKFAKQLKSFRGIEKEMMAHLQAMTDNLYEAITRGLSYDENLNSKIVKVAVTSGRSFSLNAKELPKIAGAVLINTGGATVTSFSIITSVRGDLQATIECNTNATMSFLLIGG
ncbi:hypothetical protein EBR25_12305 [bacterium]|nr:hypothetical protein [bacterium]